MGCENKYNRLPDFDMYGGDSSTWVVELFDTNNKPHQMDPTGTYTYTLSLLPYAVLTGTGDGSPVLIKDGSLSEDMDNGVPKALFSFQSNETINLRGKYVYQIEVDYPGGKKIGQGNVFIRQNINR